MDQIVVVDVYPSPNETIKVEKDIQPRPIPIETGIPALSWSLHVYPIANFTKVPQEPGIISISQPIALPAFVVNVQNTLNIDIDFMGRLPDILLSNTSLVYPYTYIEQEKDRDNIYNHKSGISYRCRLRRIVCSNTVTHEEKKLTVRHLMRRIDVVNGWLMAHVYGHDRYGRILVELFDIETKESFSDWLIEHMPSILPFLPFGIRSQK